MSKYKAKGYGYLRVSTSMQVEGYSLAAQKERISHYAEAEQIKIVDWYEDAGKSGRDIVGRDDFLRMMDDIKSEKDKVDYVLVYKLSRFGRSSVDVLTSLEEIQQHGCNLIAIEEKVHSDTKMGDFMIKIIAAMAEMERDNIIAQTTAGRRQKALEGYWNGGMAPYGYKINSETDILEIDEEEAEIIRLIFKLFTEESLGANGVATYLRDHGYKKKVYETAHKDRGKRREYFTPHFVRIVLDNPVYVGKIRYGYRKNVTEIVTDGSGRKKKVAKAIQQKEYEVFDGKHEPIISQEVWDKALDKRNRTKGKNERIHAPEHEHILSALLRCPACGSPMYGNVSRKYRINAKGEKVVGNTWYYVCRSDLKKHSGYKCTYRKHWLQSKVNAAVEEVIFRMMKDQRFADGLKARMSSSFDLDELETEKSVCEKKLKDNQAARNRISASMDSLDSDDETYDIRYDDLSTRLERLYDDARQWELKLSTVSGRIANIQKDEVTVSSVYQYLVFFKELYSKFTDHEKKQFMNLFIKEVHILEEPNEEGRFLDKIVFRFPVMMESFSEMKSRQEDGKTVELIAFLQR